MDKIKVLLKSRKFWAAIVSLVAAVSAIALGEIDVWQFVQAVVVIAGTYSTGVAIEDNGLTRKG